MIRRQVRRRHLPVRQPSRLVCGSPHLIRTYVDSASPWRISCSKSVPVRVTASPGKASRHRAENKSILGPVASLAARMKGPRVSSSGGGDTLFWKRVDNFPLGAGHTRRRFYLVLGEGNPSDSPGPFRGSSGIALRRMAVFFVFA